MEKTLSHLPLTYEDTGKGPAVVLLHGFAEDSTLWRHQVALLATSYRVIVPDLPGSGLSPLAATPSSMESFADLLHALLAHERIERCVLIGHSMGGYVALAFAEAYPGLLAGLGLFHSTAFADTPEKVQTRKRGQAFIRENGAAFFIKQTAPNLFTERFKTAHPDEVTALLQRGNAFTPEALIGYYDAMMKRPDRTQVLVESKAPVLFIAGEQDNAVPLADSLRQAALAPVTFFHILEGTAHMGMWEARDVSGKILLNYLAFVYKH